MRGYAKDRRHQCRGFKSRRGTTRHARLYSSTLTICTRWQTQESGHEKYSAAEAGRSFQSLTATRWRSVQQNRSLSVALDMAVLAQGLVVKQAKISSMADIVGSTDVCACRKIQRKRVHFCPIRERHGRAGSSHLDVARAPLPTTQLSYLKLSHCLSSLPYHRVRRLAE